MRQLRSLSAKFNLSLELLEKLIAQFNAYDFNGSGFLDKDELKQALLSFIDDPVLTGKDLDRAWAMARFTDDETVSLESFVIWYMQFRRNP